MRSVRLDSTLEDRLRRAAAAEGASVSEFIRRAAAARADTVLGSSTAELLSDVIGVVHGGGGRADRTSEAFTEALVEDGQRR
ncbi:MAG TPA: ribbon-helix-helix protein, CopG family [Actinomycetales bacterium]|nr:ribbon-helix-helix protein, CopG family [Actinomycetales bacterium]